MQGLAATVHRAVARLRVAASSPRAALALAFAVTLLALAVRWDFAMVEHPPGHYLVGDMAIYLDRGVALFTRPRTAWDTFTPIGYPALLGFFHSIAPGDVSLVGAAQAILGALTAGLTSLYAMRLSRSIAVATAAGVATALYFPLIFYTGLVLTETLFSFLLLMFVLFELRAHGGEHRRWAAGAGGALGLAILVRPSLLTLLPFVAARATRGPPAIVRTSRWTLVVALFTIAPVAAHNSAVLGRPSFVATNGGVNFFLAHSDCAAVRSRAGGPIVQVTAHYNRTHFDRLCELDAPFIQEGAYYRAGLEELHEHPARLVRAFDGIAEGLGLSCRRPWPHQPFWPGSMLHVDLIWSFSQAYFWVLFSPALIHAIVVALRRSSASAPARSACVLGWTIVASVLTVLYLYNGNPRVRVSSDPIVIALAACAWGTAMKRIREWV